MSQMDMWGGLYDENWWLEYLEGELEPNLKEDLKLLLKNSPADRRCASQLERARRLIKESDEEMLPEDGRYYDDLHDRIMAAIDEEAWAEEEEKEEVKPIDEAKRSWTASVWCAFARRWMPIQSKKFDFNL